MDDSNRERMAAEIDGALAKIAKDELAKKIVGLRQALSNCGNSEEFNKLKEELDKLEAEYNKME